MSAFTDLLARMAIAVLPRARAAVRRIQWAQQLMERPYGDRQAHLEKAIPLLEAAVRVLASRPPLPAWIWGQRFLGEAYLLREAGDAEDNIERGIAALEAAQNWTSPPDMDAWTAWQSNLGQAYVRRLKGDRAQNRLLAAATFDSVLSLPREAGKVSPGWGPSLAWFTTLAMVDDDHEFSARPGVQRRDAELSLDPQWHIPWYLEDAAGELKRGLAGFLDSGVLPARDDAARLELEMYRFIRVREMVDQLEERRSARQRTEGLFREVQASGRPFVLLLRGFNNRVTSRTHEQVVLTGTGALESFAVTDLVASTAPIPLVWIENPVESAAISQRTAEVEAEAMGFRVEAAEDWEQVVRTLIASASFIVVRNESMTPGVATEIRLVRDAGRLGDAFFEDVVTANQVSGRTDCQLLDARALAVISKHTAPRLPADPLPPALCAWISGSRRLKTEREAQALALLRKLLSAERHPMFIDLTLDVCADLVGYCVLLERGEELEGLFAQQSAIFERLGGELASVAEAYSGLAKRHAS